MELSFDHAVVRFACLTPKGQSSRLVFASVEILPHGRAAPGDTSLEESGFPPSLNTKAGRLFFRRIGLTVPAALDWYRRLDTLPDATDQPLDHASLMDEPVWSDDFWRSLVVPIPPSVFPGALEDDRIDPFVGANREAMRVHRRLTVGDPALDALRDFPDALRAEAFDWLRLRTWVDFELYPELLGSAVLVVPDPELRAIGTRLDRDDEGGEAILFEPSWRLSPTTPLKLVIRERRHGGLAFAETLDLDDTPLRVPRRQPVDTIAWEVIHPERGVIAAQPPVGFISALSLSMNAMGRKVRVEGQDGRGRKAKPSVRTVQEVSHWNDSTVGTPLDPIGRLAEGAERRRSIRASTSELWLDDPTRARETLHGMLTQARNSIFLIDPYADGLDLAQYGVSSTGAAIRVLTADRTADGTGSIPVKAGIAKLRSELGRTVEARRMPKNALHDRFLVIDEAVWLLGASLNALGSQATMLVRLQAPTPVRERLEKLWVEATPIEMDE